MGLFGGKKKMVLGLDIGTSAVKFADLKDTGRGYEIENIGLTPLPPETIVDGSLMDRRRGNRGIDISLQDKKAGGRRFRLWSFGDRQEDYPA
jgi:Tfp pilus assembly PilM family ATPase